VGDISNIMDNVMESDHKLIKATNLVKCFMEYHEEVIMGNEDNVDLKP
jgi:hypothetical protein